MDYAGINIFLIIGAALSLGYLMLINSYIKHWKNIAIWSPPAGWTPSKKLTVLIAARNESSNIVKCLVSISNQNYPKELFEIIVVDDHSEDDTVEVVKNLEIEGLKLIEMAKIPSLDVSNSFKKAALSQGINMATGQLIVSTDADCEVQSNWLRLVSSYYENMDLKFIAGPVNFQGEKTILDRFQSLDYIGMMRVTAGGIQSKKMFMANGANMAFDRQKFIDLGGFADVDQLASGDDMLLVEKFALDNPNSIGFLKNAEATVYTEAESTWKSFVNQRLRWASKTNAYQSWYIIAIQALVFLYCWFLLAGFVLALTFGGAVIFWWFVFLMIKILTDFSHLKGMAVFFNKEALLKSYSISALLHILYIAGIGLLSFFVKKVFWKGRRVK